jgi:hypothetical protein
VSRPGFAALALLVAVCGTATAGWWDDAGSARRATLDELRKDPDRWRDVTVVVDVRFAQLAEPGNAYFTRFTSHEWRAATLVAADAKPDAEPFAKVFVRRGGEGERRLAATTKGARVQLRAAVRDTAKGEPWIEALDVVVDGDPATPEETSVIARADELLAHDNAAAAETLLRGLLAKRALPKSLQADLWRKVGAAAWTQRRPADAAAAYEASLAVEPSDAATLAKLAACKAAAAAKPLGSVGAGAVGATPPAPPSSFGAPFVPAPTRRLLPPTGVPETPTERPAAEAPVSPGDVAAPAVVRPTAEAAPVPDAPAPPPPPPAPKPKLVAPK